MPIIGNAWRIRHGANFQGRRVPFGCQVDTRQARVEELQENMFSLKMIRGIFLGYHLLAGGRWEGHHLVSD